MDKDIEVSEVIVEGFARYSLKGRRVLLIIPDTTRTAPTGELVKVLYRVLKKRGAMVDLLVALGTHQPLSRDFLLRHLQMRRSIVKILVT